MGRFFFGVLVTLLILIAVPLIVLGSGVLNMAATEGPGTLETSLAGWTVDRSVAARAPDEINPFKDDSEAIEKGLMHYRAMCVQCHGASSIEADDFAQGLNPSPPDLAMAGKEWTDGELFWIAKHGIRMTGMPAFGKSHSDEEIWQIVAFVRELDDLSETQVAALQEGRKHDHHQAEVAGREHQPASEHEAAGHDHEQGPAERTAEAPNDEPKER
jgi:mono/diheme cytochrome c family protein